MNQKVMMLPAYLEWVILFTPWCLFQVLSFSIYIPQIYHLLTNCWCSLDIDFEKKLEISGKNGSLNVESMLNSGWWIFKVYLIDKSENMIQMSSFLIAHELWYNKRLSRNIFPRLHNQAEIAKHSSDRYAELLIYMFAQTYIQ